MEFWQLLTLVGTMATILGVFLAVYALINNKTLKTESRLTREMIVKMEEGIKETLNKMDGTLKEIAHLIVVQGEGLKEIAHLIQKTQELIIVEGERTRREIKA